MAAVLRERGAKVWYEEFPEGHNWKNCYPKLYMGRLTFFPYNEIR